MVRDLWHSDTHCGNKYIMQGLFIRSIEEGKLLLDDSEIKKLIMMKQSNSRISCKAAMEIADETGAQKSKIGRLLDEMKIKIHSCQLGCFN